MYWLALQFVPTNKNKPSRIFTVVCHGHPTEKYPCKDPMLITIKYCDIIRDLAARGCTWRYCDESFRYLWHREPQAYSWGSVHWELWNQSQLSKHNTP